MATRFQGDRQMLVVPDQPGSSLDPSSAPGTHHTAKVGFDLTHPLEAKGKTFAKAEFPRVELRRFGLWQQETPAAPPVSSPAQEPVKSQVTAVSIGSVQPTPGGETNIDVEQNIKNVVQGNHYEYHNPTIFAETISVPEPAAPVESVAPEALREA